MKDIKANYEILKNEEDRVVIRDIGPWDQFMQELYRDAILTNAKRLFYFDSEGQYDEIIHDCGRFKGFRPGTTNQTGGQ